MEQITIFMGLVFLFYKKGDLNHMNSVLKTIDTIEQVTYCDVPKFVTN